MAEQITIVKGGELIDVDGRRPAEVAVADGRVVAVGQDLSGDRVLDAGGCIVTTGLVDLCAALGEPGREESETIASATRAAALGGYTAVVARSDSNPAADSAAAVRDIAAIAVGACCDVEIAGALTVDRRGEQLAPMGEMAMLGVRLFSDGPDAIQDARLMRRLLEYASDLGVVVAHRPQEATLAGGGHMHEGAVSSALGIGGIPAEAEELMVMRDVALARLCDARVHFEHISAAGSVAIIRAARAGGLSITASVTPHHLAYSDESVRGYDTRFKSSPPLRSADDRAALATGLADGVIDAIATDHTPIEAHRAEAPFDQAPGGTLGLETALAAAITKLDLPLEQILAAMSWRPAMIAGIADRHGPRIEVGRPANLIVIDPNATWVVAPDSLASRSANTAFAGETLRGRVRHTILGGETVVLDGEVQR